jgi:hypothetical protein
MNDSMHKSVDLNTFQNASELNHSYVTRRIQLLIVSHKVQSRIMKLQIIWKEGAFANFAEMLPQTSFGGTGKPVRSSNRS